MLKRLVRTGALAALTILATAPFAAAQNADQNTAGPTKNQLQLRLTEPREGQQITGPSVRVAVDYNRTIFGAGTGTRFGEKNFPMPIFDVYVDNALKQSLKGGESNVANIDGLPMGKHKIVVMAKNISGEIIDRAEVNVVNIEGTASAWTSAPAATTDTSSASSSAPAYVPPPPAPAPAPVAEASAPPATSSASSDNLPATGSNAPTTALLGLTLLAGGLWTARRTH